jgi:hypothetical protein
MVTKRVHWTDGQRWRNLQTGETVSAAVLIERHGRYLRMNRLSLCDATFDVRMDDDSVWRRLRAWER